MIQNTMCVLMLIKSHVCWMQYLNVTSVDILFFCYDVLNSNPDPNQHHHRCQAPLHPTLPLKDVKKAHNTQNKKSSTSFHSIYRLLFKGAVMNEYVWDGRCVDTLMHGHLSSTLGNYDQLSIHSVIAQSEAGRSCLFIPIQPHIMCLYLNDTSGVCGRQQLR